MGSVPYAHIYPPPYRAAGAYRYSVTVYTAYRLFAKDHWPLFESILKLLFPLMDGNVYMATHGSPLSHKVG